MTIKKPSASLGEGKDYSTKLKRLIFYRIFVTSILLGFTFLIHLKNLSALSLSPVNYFIGLASFIFILTVVYIVLLYILNNQKMLATLQITVDTVIISFIVYLSGGFASYYSFLYPALPIYSSVFIDKRTTLIISGLACFQYAFLIGLEYFNFIPSFVPDWVITAANYPLSFVSFKTALVIIACLIISFLSNYLMEQARGAKKELKAMQDHVVRLDKLASLGEMAAGLAHEIKNPLASMTGSIQMLQEGFSGDPDQEKLMTIVIREAKRLSKLVNNFLLFAKSPHGQQVTVDVNKEINETLELLKKDRDHTGVSIEYQLDPNAWVVMDRVHLRQILWNLILNAVEAVKDTGHVFIRTEVIYDQVIIKVSDNGEGITPENLDRIFLPFHSSKPRGTGLGLSIVHNLLEGYNSRLDIISRVGEGTTVTFKLRHTPPPKT